jgi:predicted kinase
MNQHNKPTLFLICGLPGSGKSTFAAKLKKEKDIDHHYEADMKLYEDGVYVFARKKLPSAHRWCQQMTKRAMQQQKDVIVSNTTLRKKEAKPYIELAKQYEYNIEIIHMTGNYESIHGVPKDVYYRMESVREFFTLQDFNL